MMLTLSRERSSIESTVEAYIEWGDIEVERQSLLEMERESTEMDFKEMARQEQRELVARQETLEKDITLMLLPRDPNDDRNVMLEVRAGTGGDEASIWAGDLVALYRKYADTEGWKVSTMTVRVNGISELTDDYLLRFLKFIL